MAVMTDAPMAVLAWVKECINEGDNKLISCAMVNLLVSVLYIDCPTFIIAFGSAIGLVSYVQVAVFIICFGIILDFYKRLVQADPNGIGQKHCQ